MLKLLQSLRLSFKKNDIELIMTRSRDLELRMQSMQLELHEALSSGLSEQTRRVEKNS